jgi:serine/threonine-protein kinase
VTRLRSGALLGKYRIKGRIGEGGFATVYRALDTIEGIPVALKIPHKDLVTKELLADLRKEVRLTAKLDHPNILPVKNADFIERQFTIVYPLGEGTLDDRLCRRMSGRTSLDLARQLLDALAYAHQHRIIHCDVKPENLILFSGPRLRLADFGIAKVAHGTGLLVGKGTGTLGFVAPEQALGKPSLRSDVFSAGLVLYRMFTGRLPEWPYEWPPPELGVLRRRLRPEFVAFMRRALEVNERRRYRDATQMLAEFKRVKDRALKGAAKGRRPRKKGRPVQDWKALLLRDFRRRYGATLRTRSECSRCGGPVGEAMQHCPWCGIRRPKHRGTSDFPRRCKRCGRGIKSDWRFCAWCHGAAIGPFTDREYTDKRYSARCRNPSCRRKELMPFMKYCPWCRTKVARRWTIPDSRGKCRRCGWGVAEGFWDYCAWCGRKQDRKHSGKAGST